MASVGDRVPQAAAVSVRGLVKSYGEIDAVRGIDLEVHTGETFGFLGPNGAGKSTTISMLCTLLRPTAGNADVAGFDVVHQRDDVRRHIGLVFQDQTLDGYLSAQMNLRLHGELYGVPTSVLPDRIERILKMVGLWDRRKSKVAEYCDRIAIIDDGQIIALDTPEALKAGVGKDRIRIRTDDDEATRLLKERFALDAKVSEGELTFSVEQGKSFVPRLFSELPVAIRSVNVARPTLDDVFMTYTGRTIRDAEASAGDMNKQMMARRFAPRR